MSRYLPVLSGKNEFLWRIIHSSYILSICAHDILYDLLDDQVQEEEMGVHVARMARKTNA